MAKNPIYESALDKQGLTWRYLEYVAYSDIDEKKGLHNQARLDVPLDEEYARSFIPSYKEKPCIVPALVLTRPSTRAKWVPCDGNHRLKGGKLAGLTGSDAYVFETTDQLIVDRVTWSFNNQVNGKRLTNEECKQHAITFVRKYGASVKEAAEQWGIIYATLKGLLIVENIKDILNEAKIDHRHVAGQTLDSLSPLINLGEDVLCKAAKIIATNGLGVKQAQEIVTKVKVARTHEQKLQVIEDFSKLPETLATKAETRGGRIQRPKRLPRDVLEDLIVNGNIFLEKWEDDALRPPQFKMRKAREAVTDYVNRLIRVYGLGALLPSVNGKESVG